MDHYTVLSLGRNLGIFLVSISLDDLSALDLQQRPEAERFLRQLVRAGRFILGRPQTDNVAGHFVCVHARFPPSASNASASVGIEERPIEDCQWVLVDSTRHQTDTFTSLSGLLQVPSTRNSSQSLSLYFYCYYYYYFIFYFFVLAVRSV
jgi:hypothetical protein